MADRSTGPSEEPEERDGSNNRFTINQCELYSKEGTWQKVLLGSKKETQPNMSYVSQRELGRYVMQGGLQRKRLNRGKLAVAVLLILPELLVWDCSISITLKALGHSFLYVTNPTMRLSATCAALVPVMMAFLVLRGVCGQTFGITWNGIGVANNSLITLSVVTNRVSTLGQSMAQSPLTCLGIAGGQWYKTNGVPFPLATPDPTITPGGLGQRNVPGGVELYRGTPSVFPHGIQCCTNGTTALCIGMYSDLTLAESINLQTSSVINYALSMAAAYGPNITGGVQFELLTPTNIDPPVFQLTCTSTSSPPTFVQWAMNGSPVNGGNYTSSQTVTDQPTSTYNNTLTVTGRAPGMYTCTITTTCSPVCGATGFTSNPRSTTSSLIVQAPPDPPTDVTAVQSGPTSVKVSWAAPTSGGPVTRYDVYYVASGIEITSGGSTNSYIHVLSDLQAGVQYKIFVIAVGTYMPSEPSHVAFVAKPAFGPVTGLRAFNNTFTTITFTWTPPPAPPSGIIITYQVTYSTTGSMNSYNITMPPITVRGLAPRTTYSFSVVGYTLSESGLPQEIQTATAAIPKVPGLVVSGTSTISVRVSWLSVQLPSDGTLTGYTLYYRYLRNTSADVRFGWSRSHSFPPVTTSGDITDLTPNGVYHFSVVSEVAISGELHRGDSDASLAVNPFFTSCSPGTIPPVQTCDLCDVSGTSSTTSVHSSLGVVLGGAGAVFVVLAAVITTAIILAAIVKRKWNVSITKSKGHAYNCDAIPIQQCYAYGEIQADQHYEVIG